MFRSLLWVLMVVAGSMAAAGSTLVIKFSRLDCATCNLKFKAYAGMHPLVVFKNEEDSNAFHEIREYLSSNDFSTVVSDSLFYVWDRSERSKIYVVEGGNVLYQEILASSDVARVKMLLSGSPKPLNIGSTVINDLSGNGRYLYMAALRHMKIYRADKRNPNLVIDSLSFTKDQIEQTVYKASFGARYQDTLLWFNNTMKYLREPKRVELVSMQAVNDTIHLLVYVNTIATKGEDTIIRISPAILRIADHKIQSCYRIDPSEKSLGPDIPGKYLNAGSFFIYFQGTYYFTIAGELNPVANPMLARQTIVHDKLFLAQAVPYYYPDNFVRTKVANRMSGMSYNNGLCSYTLSSDIYNLSDQQVYHLGMSDSIIYDLDSVLNLTADVKFMGVDFYLDKKNDLHYIYESGDTLYAARYHIKNGKPSLVSRKTLSTDAEQRKQFRLITCDATGFYSYDSRARSISFNAY